MQRLSESQKRFLREATTLYHKSLPGSTAADYLASRGLEGPELEKFRLGYVVDPLPGHEQYEGMLAIPYLRWSQEHGWAVVSIRYRRLDGQKPKYMTQAGDRPRLYNTLALLKPSPVVAITEGEIDAITATLAGIPAVGLPGATSWQGYFKEPFLGYKEVYVLADGDQAGTEFANKIARELPNAKVIPCPPGEDVNSLVVAYGPAALKERIR